MSRVSRRFWLKSMSAGAVLLTTPFLRTLRSEGAPTAAPKRLFVFGSPNGTIMQDFWPADGTTYPRILKPLEPLRSKLNILRGVDWKTTGVDPVPKDHLPDFFNMLTARQPVGTYGTIKPTGISVDQYVANKIGTTNKFKSLQLGVQAYVGNGGMANGGDGAPIPVENSPFKAFQRVFADLSAPDTMAATRLRNERKSILDAVSGELTDLRCDLGAEERPKFDAHIDAVRELEKSFEVKNAVGDFCAAPAMGASFDVNADANYPKVTQLHLDLVTAAFACDLTRVVTMQFGNGNIEHPWAGVAHGHHDIAHGNFPLTPEQQRDWGAAIDTWYAQQFAYVLKKLDAIPEGAGTMLDNTLCIWSHEQSNASTHQRTDHPYVLAGGSGGALKTGRVIHCKGAAHNGLLISVANAMGVPTTSFGDPAFSSGPLSLLA